MMDIKGAKLSVCGLQGGGKTYFAIEEVKKQNLRVLVFSPHAHDFDSQPDKNFIFYNGFDPSANGIERFFKIALQMCKDGLIDGVFIDEFDMVYKNNFEIGKVATDVFANHRHYNMCIIMVTRRPQDIPTYVFEASKYVVSFCLQGENARQKFNGMYKGMGDQIINLDYDKHNYIMKQIGKPPVLCDAI